MSVSNNRPLRSTALFDPMAAQFLPNEHHYNSRMGGGWGWKWEWEGEKDEQTAVRGPTIVQWNWSLFAMDTFLADLGSARLSADMDRNSGGLTASRVVAIVALVASVTNNQFSPYCTHTTGLAPPGVKYVQSFLNNASDYDGHTFPLTITIPTSATTTNSFLQTSFPTAYPVFYFTYPLTFLTARALPTDEYLMFIRYVAAFDNCFVLQSG